MPSLLTLDEVAERLNVSRRTVERLVHGGDLAATKIGRAVRVHPQAVEGYIRHVTVTPPQPVTPGTPARRGRPETFRLY